MSSSNAARLPGSQRPLCPHRRTTLRSHQGRYGAAARSWHHRADPPVRAAAVQTARAPPRASPAASIREIAAHFLPSTPPPCRAPAPSSPPACSSPSARVAKASHGRLPVPGHQHCAPHHPLRHQEVGPLALPLSQVPPPELCRVGRRVHPSLVPDTRLLPAPA